MSKRWPQAAGLWTIGLLHCVIVAYALQRGGDLTSFPIRNDDSAGHFYTATHAVAHSRATGAPVGYDSGWMAGYPEGVVGIVDNKLFELLVALAPRGFEAAAYNAGFLLALLCPPWLIYAASRAGCLSGACATGAAFCAVLASFTIPIVVHFMAWGGVSYVLASVLVVPAAVGVGRAVATEGLWTARGLIFLGLAFLAFFVHPAQIPALVAALLPAAVVARRRPFRLLRDAGLVAIVFALALLPVLSTYVGLRGALLTSDPQGHFLHGGLTQLRQDWWSLLFKIDRRPRGAGGLLGLLALALMGAGRAAVSASAEGGWAAERQTRWIVWCCAMACFALAYLLEPLFPRAADLQPYRYVVPFAFFLCLPAGEALAKQVAELRVGRGWSWPVGVGAVAVAVRAAVALSAILVFGVGWDSAEEALAAYVQRNDDGGRWVVESRFEPRPASASAKRTISVKRFALVPLFAPAEFLGYAGTGPISVQRYATFRHGLLLGRRISDIDEELLHRYAVTHVVGCAPQTVRDLRRLTTVLEPEASLADCWSFRVRNPEPSRVLVGRGEVRAGLDRIEVRQAEGDRIVLKYHWLPTLRTEPPLPIEEAPQPGAPVGFIAVQPGGQRDFDIVQSRLPSAFDLVLRGGRMFLSFATGRP